MPAMEPHNRRLAKPKFSLFCAATGLPREHRQAPERAQDAVKEEQATQMRDKIMSATFDFNDFLTQMEMMQNMGGMGGLRIIKNTTVSMDF